jgi:hypothetical protein
MGDKPADGKPQPSLELPPLFGRRNRRNAEGPPRAAVAPEPPVPDEPETEPTVPAGGRRRARPRQSVPGRARARTRPSVPHASAQLAAVFTGVLVGLFGAGLTYASLQGCEAVRGTTSCGGPGLFLLVAILVLMVLLGGLLLALFKVSDARSTSFLAVGVTTVVVLVTLMEELFSPWMFLVVPVISAASFSLARWVTTRFVEPAESGPTHDVR